MKKYWWRICLKPQKTFTLARQHRGSKTFHCLASIIGLPVALHLMQRFSMGLDVAALWLWVAAVILSPFVGLAVIYIFGAVLYWVGKKLKGEGSFADIREAIAWSNTPMMLSTLSWFIMTLGFGSPLFTFSFIDRVLPTCEMGCLWFLFATSLLQLVAVVWSLLLLVKIVSMVQRFSLLKSVANIFIPYVVIILITALLR